MQYNATVAFKQRRGTYLVEGDTIYAAKLEAAKHFLADLNFRRPHDDKRRPYDILVRPYWLVAHGYIHLAAVVDRRLKT